MKHGLLVVALLLAAGAAAAQSTSAPQQPAAEPAKPAAAKPALKLRLDELDPEPPRTYAPREPEKEKDATRALPGLGGRPAEVWDQRKTDPVPPATAGDSVK